MSADHGRSMARSASGIPSSSAITVDRQQLEQVGDQVELAQLAGLVDQPAGDLRRSAAAGARRCAGVKAVLTRAAAGGCGRAAPGRSSASVEQVPERRLVGRRIGPAPLGVAWRRGGRSGPAADRAGGALTSAWRLTSHWLRPLVVERRAARRAGGPGPGTGRRRTPGSRGRSRARRRDSPGCSSIGARCVASRSYGWPSAAGGMLRPTTPATTRSSRCRAGRPRTGRDGTPARIGPARRSAGRM